MFERLSSASQGIDRSNALGNYIAANHPLVGNRIIEAAMDTGGNFTVDAEFDIQTIILNAEAANSVLAEHSSFPKSEDEFSSIKWWMLVNCVMGHRRLGHPYRRGVANSDFRLNYGGS